jgi:ankyrin repeat protein
MKYRHGGAILLLGLLITLIFSCTNFLTTQPEKLIDSIKKGDLAQVKILLDNGADVNAKHGEGSTALMVAAQTGHLQIVKLLLEKGADMNAESDYVAGVDAGQH